MRNRTIIFLHIVSDVPEKGSNPNKLTETAMWFEMSHGIASILFN